MKLSRFMTATALTSAALAFPHIALAQDATAEAPTTVEEAQDSGESIIVTGSRIRRPNLDSPIPVASISGEELFQQGQTNVGETLNELPQLRGSVTQQNPGLGVGIAGLNLLDLRGLGSQRTLVLVNGRRHVAADILNNAVSPDINTIPNDLVERVEVVTGGNSAVYGSDAIAGVVNFILKKDFDGLQVRGQTGISQEGYGANQYISAMFGKNFSDGRGNITLHGEYVRQQRVFGSDVPFLRTVDQLASVDIDPGGLTNGSDGIPDRIFVRDIRSASIHRYGLVPISYAPGAGQCGNGINNQSYNCTYIFQPDGSLVQQTGARFGSGVIGGITGGNGQTGREENLISVLPGMERYNANLLARFEFSPAAEAFVEAKYVRVNVRGSNPGPGGIQGQFTQFDFRERFRLDNPFLNPAARTLIANAISASGCRPGLATTCEIANVDSRTGGPLTAQDRAAIADGSFRFVTARNLLDIGARDERFKRETVRVVGGLRGTFNDDWGYEFSANYGRFNENTTTQGYVDRQRFMLSLDAGFNPGTNRIQCRAQFVPAAAVQYGTSAAAASRLAADIAACQPYNPFGVADNSAAASYFSANYTNKSYIEQLVFQGFVSGDLSQLFELPGGPVRFVVGGEYRREKSRYEQDAYSASGLTNAVAFGTFAPPAFVVKEAFGEVQIPLLRDTPFFHELTVTGAGRVAGYQGATGTVYAYNGGVEWAPIRDIRFRANYGRAIRAPNSSETFGPLIPNFAPGFNDPCTTANIGSGTQFRAANCQTDLGALLPNIAGLSSQSLPVLSGVNPNLREETSDSYTVGAVFQPTFVPGLSLSVDYYKIKVDGVIVAVSAQQIANGCYDAPTLSNPFCGLFQRFRGPGTGPFGESVGAIQGNTLIQAPLNYAKRIRSGIDVELAYRTSITDDVSLETKLIYAHGLQNSNYQDPTRPNYENRLLGELGDPQDEALWNVTLKTGPFSLGYQMRYIGKMWVNAYENYNSLQGRPPQDLDYAKPNSYPEVFYHDLRFNWAVAQDSAGRNIDFYFGIDNVLNTNPPLGQSATGERVAAGGDGGNIYLIRGRNFYAGFKAKF